MATRLAVQALAPRTIRGARLLPALAVAVALVTLLSLCIGAFPMKPQEILVILAGAGSGDTAEAVLLSIRLPRVILGLAGGAALAVAGAAIQGLFRNPLADPGLIGVSAGAALFAAAAIVLLPGAGALLGPAHAVWLLPLAAFAGGLAATLLVGAIARREGGVDTALLLLAGVAVNAVAGAGVGFLVFLSDERELREVSFWMLGSLAGTGWDRLLPALPLLVLPALAMPFLARSLNALLLGEADAFHLGFRVEPVKRAVVLLAALGTGATVALAGMIGFIGLVAPHLARLVAGPDHRVLLPASAMIGAGLLLLADLAARTVALPAEMPIGVLTSALGGPFFIWLLRRRTGGAQ